MRMNATPRVSSRPPAPRRRQPHSLATSSSVCRKGTFITPFSTQSGPRTPPRSFCMTSWSMMLPPPSFSSLSVTAPGPSIVVVSLWGCCVWSSAAARQTGADLAIAEELVGGQHGGGLGRWEARGQVDVIVAEDERGSVPESVPVGRVCVSADGVKNGEARDGIMEEDIREGVDAVHAIGGCGREREGAAGWLLWMWPLGNCCQSKPIGEQRRATRRAGRLLGRW